MTSLSRKECYRNNHIEAIEMSKIMNIFQRINAVMKEVEYVQKGSAKVNGQYSFVSHDAVTAALHKPLADHGIVMVPSVLELTQDGNRTVARVQLAFVNIDEPTDHIAIMHYGYGIDTQDKGIGKAVSYAVKYGLLKLFCLETGDDVEKHDIEYKAPVVKASAETILAQKKALLDTVGIEEKESVSKFFSKLSKARSKTVDELVMTYDVNTFESEYSLWKNKQKEKEEKAA